MEAAVLYSGGKDCSLAAYILDKLGYEVRLVTATFGICDSFKYAKEAADAMGFDHETKKLKRDIIEEATERIILDGFPRNGINIVHRHAIEEVAGQFCTIADGTRRDDKAPWLNLPEIRSLEDRLGIEYISPLRGIGYKTVKKLVSDLLIIEEGVDINKGDYEVELREFLRKKGYDVKEHFLVHKQSRLLEMR